jgi:hypothetical protein
VFNIDFCFNFYFILAGLNTLLSNFNFYIINLFIYLIFYFRPPLLPNCRLQSPAAPAEGRCSAGREAATVRSWTRAPPRFCRHRRRGHATTPPLLPAPLLSPPPVVELLLEVEGWAIGGATHGVEVEGQLGVEEVENGRKKRKWLNSLIKNL